MNIIDDLKNRKLFTQVIDTKAVIDALGQGGEESGGGSSGGGSTPVSGSSPALFAASNLGGNDAMMGWECEGTVHYDTITFAVPEEGGDGGDDELAPVSVQYPTRIDWNKKSLYFTNNGTTYSFDLVALGNKVKSGQVNNRALVQAVEDHFAAEKAGEEVSHWYNPLDMGRYDDKVPDWPIVDNGDTYYQDILKDYLVGNYPDSAKDAHYFGMVGDMESTGALYKYGAKMYYFDLGALGIEDHFSRTFDYYNYVYHPDPFGNTDGNGWWEEVSYADAQGNTEDFEPFNGYIDTLSDSSKTKQFPYSFVNINQHLNNTPKIPRTMTEEEMDEIQGIIQTIAMLDDIDGGQRSSWMQDQWSAQWQLSNMTPANISIISSGRLENESDTYGITDGISPLWGIDNMVKLAPLAYPMGFIGPGWEDVSSDRGYYFPMLDCSPDPMSFYSNFDDNNYGEVGSYTFLTYFNAASEDEEYNEMHHPFFGVENPDLVTSTQQPVWTASPKKGDIINYGIVLIPFNEAVDLTEDEEELANNYNCPGELYHTRYYFKALYYVEVANHDLFPWGKDLGNSEYVDIKVNSYVFNPDYVPNEGGGGIA